MLLLAAAALAAFPEDVSLLAMEDYGGQSTTTTAGEDYVVTGYHTLVRELGGTIANPMGLPGETLGINGFYLGVTNSFAFIRTGTLDGVNPTGWDLADPDEHPPGYFFLPGIQVRKGLPLSLELGANFTWIGATRTVAMGGYGRWAPIEGYRRVPDVAIQIGYSGYIGNDELELGVMDTSLTVGYTVPFGVTEGIHQATFSPFVSFGQERIHAAPRVDLTGSRLDGRITEVSGFKSDGEFFDKPFAPYRIGGGFRIVNGEYTGTFSASYPLGAAATVNLAFGFTY
jgi:hypothetical protein